MTASSPSPRSRRSGSASRQREVMRQRLLESALLVFADKGVDAWVIDDVVQRAGVARGTFYHYFPTSRDILGAVGEGLAADLMAMIGSTAGAAGDPAVRVAAMVALFVGVIRDTPLLLCFTRRAGLSSIGPAVLTYDLMQREIEAGVAAGRFTQVPVAAALNHVRGNVLMCLMQNDTTDCVTPLPVAESYGIAATVALILQGLGLSSQEAASIAALPCGPLPAPPPEGLIARSLRRGIA